MNETLRSHWWGKNFFRTKRVKKNLSSLETKYLRPIVFNLTMFLNRFEVQKGNWKKLFLFRAAFTNRSHHPDCLRRLYKILCFLDKVNYIRLRHYFPDTSFLYVATGHQPRIYLNCSSSYCYFESSFIYPIPQK